MEQLIVMIVYVDDENPESLTEIWQRPLPQVSLEKLEAEGYLDKMEDTVSDIGSELMRQLLDVSEKQ